MSKSKVQARQTGRRRTCKCQWCVKWSPIIRRARSKTSGRLQKDFDDLITHMMSEGEDGDVAQAKLDGSWPGWEWITEAIRAHQDKPSGLAGDRQPEPSKTGGVKALASATCSDARPPKRIWLQWDGDATEGSPLPMEKRGEVTWCGDKIFKRDVMYIRSDCVKRQNAKAQAGP